MTTHPNPPPGHVPRHAAGGADADRHLVPVAAGVAPTVVDAAATDWSSGPLAASVGRLVGTLQAADRLVAQAVEELVRVVDTGATDHVLGVAVEVVLAQSCRTVRFERTTLLRAVALLSTMPATRAAFRDGWLSWSQVRAIVTAARHLHPDDRAVLDDTVGGLALTYADCEADGLVHEVDWRADQLQAARTAGRPRRTVQDDALVLQPDLEGGGRIFAAYGPDRFPLMAQALDTHDPAGHVRPDPDPDVGVANPAALDARGGLLGVACAPDTFGDADAALTDAHRHAARLARGRSRRRAAAMFERVTGCANDSLAPLQDQAAHRNARVPSVLVTCSLDTLLGGTTPAWVLSTLAGRMKVDAATARRWADAQGANARLVVLDEVGQVVGVGRRRRFADGWLRDAIVARDLHDTAPASTTAAALCHVDHTVDWTAGGRTDVDNLSLVSARWNQAKQRGDWTLHRHPDGSRTWIARSGYTVRQGSPSHTMTARGPTTRAGP